MTCEELPLTFPQQFPEESAHFNSQKEHQTLCRFWTPPAAPGRFLQVFAQDVVNSWSQLGQCS